MTLPRDLPKGCKRRLRIHINFGNGGSASYTIHLPNGDPLPISYQYDTRKKAAAPTGFFIEGVERCFSNWAEVRAYWAEHYDEITKERP